MYIALYDDNMNHITNVDGVIYELTTRVYDKDTFSASGMSNDEIKAAKIAILNDEYGNMEYACLVDNIKIAENKVTIKGLDFKILWENQVLIDYTSPGSFDGRLSIIFNKISSLLFNVPDTEVNRLPITVNIPIDYSDATSLGNYQDSYLITDAYKFLKLYLKSYEYSIVPSFDIVNKKIVFDFVKNTTEIEVNLKDFMFELTTTSTATNKTIATIKYDPEVENENGEVEIIPRPSSIATVYYYLTKDNQIVASTEKGPPRDSRIYPVVTKIYEDDYLAKAQFNAVYELANSRYVDNIIIDNSTSVDPISLRNHAIYTKIRVYIDGIYYKTLPITEKTLKLDGGGLSVKVKLGFKKILLTEIIK